MCNRIKKLAFLILFLLGSNLEQVKAQSHEDSEWVAFRGKFFDQNDIQEDRARFWFNFYAKSARKSFLQHLTNGDEFRIHIEYIFTSYGLPLELYYVGLIESGYQNLATSSKKARGPWQFMPGTAIKYGLRVDAEIDERLSIPKSTKAAANYLLDLYNIFHNWALASAAYNAGEFKIVEAVRKGNTRNLRTLCEQKLLAQETCDYVAKIWVAKELDLRRSEFGLPQFSQEHKNDRLWRGLPIKRATHVTELAFTFGISEEQLLKYNPDLIGKNITATLQKPVMVYLPNSQYQQSIQIMLSEERRALIVKNPAPLKKFGLELRSGDSIFIKKTANEGLEMLAPSIGKTVTISTTQLEKLKLSL